MLFLTTGLPLLIALTTFLSVATNTFISAFAPSAIAIHRPRSFDDSSTRRFETDDKKDDTEIDDTTTENTTTTTTTTTATMLIKNIPTGEVKEVPFYDPYMEANTDATMISSWAVVLFGFPTVLLLNDVFHFLPNDGIFGQLQQFF